MSQATNVLSNAARVQIIGVTTKDVHRKFQECAHRGGYHVEEWLTLGHNGQGLRVAATMRVKGEKHGLAFKWDGEDINVLATRVMGLDYAMSKLPDMVAQGRGAPWETH